MTKDEGRTVSAELPRWYWICHECGAGSSILMSESLTRDHAHYHEASVQHFGTEVLPVDRANV